MTISTTTSRVSFAGNASTVNFATGFKFFAATDLTVIIVTDSTGAEVTKTLTTHYSVAGAGSDSGGTVTMGAAPASGETIVIVRTQPYTQGLDLVENDPFPSDSVEETLDKIVVMTQQNDDALLRSVRKAEGFTETFDPTLPKIITGSTVLAFNAGATAFEIGPTTAAISGAAANATAAASSATSAAASATTASAYAGTQTVDLFNGTGSQTAFTLSVAPANGDENNTSVFISGVYQQKNTYAVSGTTLTFSTAPPSATGNVEVLHMSLRAIETPADGSVTYPKFASGLVDIDLSSVSGSDNTIASAKSIKTYVDAQVTASDLDFAGGSGTGAVDLDSQTFTVAGTANEIETAASGQTITVGLPANVTIAGVTTHGGNVVSDTDSTDSLGTTGVRWAGTWTDAINGVTAPTAQYTSAEETKLAGIEASADVTDATNVASALSNGVAALTSGEVTQLANIGTAAISAAEWGYVAASTQAYDSADHTKLNGIEALADVTDATNVLAGLVGQEAVATGFTGTLDGVLGGGTPAAATVTQLTSGGVIVSDTDSTDDLGTTGVRWRALYVDAITATDQITATGFTGTLDGILGSGAAAAASVTTLSASSTISATNAAGPSIRNVAATATVPPLNPNKADANTGVGWVSADIGSLVAGGVEALRWANGTVTIAGNLATAAGGIATASLADNSVTLAKMAGGTDGNLITYDASGDPAYVAAGSSGQILTSQGAGSVPVFASAGSSGGKILQVIEATTTTEVSTTSTSYVDTALTGTITPSATDSKILVLISLSVSSAGGAAVAECKIVRTIGSTATDKYVYSQISAPENQKGNHFLSVLDSPSSTSACVYKVQAFLTDQSGTLQFQRNDGADIARSTITLMEVGA